METLDLKNEHKVILKEFIEYLNSINLDEYVIELIEFLKNTNLKKYNNNKYMYISASLPVPEKINLNNKNINEWRFKLKDNFKSNESENSLLLENLEICNIPYKNNQFIHVYIYNENEFRCKFINVYFLNKKMPYMFMDTLYAYHKYSKSIYNIYNNIPNSLFQLDYGYEKTVKFGGKKILYPIGKDKFYIDLDNIHLCEYTQNSTKIQIINRRYSDKIFLQKCYIFDIFSKIIDSLNIDLDETPINFKKTLEFYNLLNNEENEYGYIYCSRCKTKDNLEFILSNRFEVCEDSNKVYLDMTYFISAIFMNINIIEIEDCVKLNKLILYHCTFKNEKFDRMKLNKVNM